MKEETQKLIEQIRADMIKNRAHPPLLRMTEAEKKLRTERKEKAAEGSAALVRNLCRAHRGDSLKPNMMRKQSEIRKRVVAAF
jgi:hypothetical protein